MDKKCALVVGASSDIGLEIVQTLANLGYNVAAHYLNNANNLQKIKTEYDSHENSIELFKHDLKDHKNASSLVNEVVDKFESIDVLVNAIGPFYYRDILETNPEEWKEEIDLNLNVVFNVTAYAKDHLIKSKGHIVNFAYSGAENKKAYPMSAGYCSAKAGVVVLTKSLAAKLAPMGVRVNAINPGLIEASTTTEKEREEMAKSIPFGRPGTPREVADVLNWILTDSPQYMTGAFIPIAGAWEY
ncbi:MAG: SDR family oxidoreductase [Pseudomonadota bacterium]